MARDARHNPKLARVAEGTKPPATLDPEIQAAPHRLSFALKELAAGNRYCELRDKIEKKFRVSRATAERDIKRAYAAIAEEDREEIPQLAARISSRVWNIATRSEKKKSFAISLMAYQTLMKLHGLEAARNVNITHSGTIGQTTTARRARIQELLEKGRRKLRTSNTPKPGAAP